MKCHVINLDRSPERLAHITQVFDALGLQFERLAAVDGDQIDDAQLQRLTPPGKWPRVINRYEVGCFLSHRLFLRQVAESDAPWGAVFEDDVAISPHIKPLLENTDWIPEGTDIVKLDTARRKCTVSRPRRIAVQGDYQLGRLLSRHYGTGGYIVSKQCAKKLYELTDHVSAPIDYLYFSPDFGLLRELNVQQLIPAPVIHLGLDSSIGHRPDEKVVSWRRRAVKRIRRTWRGYILAAWLALTRGCRTGKIPFK